jgi:hypothetical protein
MGKSKIWSLKKTTVMNRNISKNIKNLMNMKDLISKKMQRNRSKNGVKIWFKKKQLLKNSRKILMLLTNLTYKEWTWIMDLKWSSFQVTLQIQTHNKNIPQTQKTARIQVHKKIIIKNTFPSKIIGKTKFKILKLKMKSKLLINLKNNKNLL